MLSTFPQVSMLGVIKKREGRLKGPTPLPQFGEILSEEVHFGVWDIPCIARVMVWISFPGGGSKVSQQAGWNDF